MIRVIVAKTKQISLPAAFDEWKDCYNKLPTGAFRSSIQEWASEMHIAWLRAELSPELSPATQVGKRKKPSS